MAYKRRNNGKYKPDWDRGNGWKTTRDEWQDFDKAEDLMVTVEELKELRCPASGSSITVLCDHIHEGLSFVLNVSSKEYRPNLGPYGSKYQYRKPTQFCRVLDGKTSYCIPFPGSASEHVGGWHEKKSWSQAVKTLLNEIIPIYDSFYSNASPTVQLRSVVPRQGKELREVQKSREEEASAS